MTDKMTLVGTRKVVIIGAGFVGASIAYALTIKNLAREIILVDIDEKKARGEAADISHGIAYMGTSVVRAGDYSDCIDTDLIIVTAGRNRRPGESRLDMISDNIDIMRNVVESIKPYYTKGVMMIVSNPVDIMTYACDQWMGLPNGKVFGTGCVLDTSRLVREIANYTHLNTEVVKCNIVGEHGDSQFPVWSRVAIAGVPIDEYCQNVGLKWDEDQKAQLDEKVKNLGGEIIKAKGKTHYGIATCVCSLADAVLNQRLTIAPVTSPLRGEYSIRDVSLSLPSIVGVNGVEMRLEERWSDQEFERFRKSARAVGNAMRKISL